MSYLGNQPSSSGGIQLPLAVESGGTGAATVVGAKTALGIISGPNDGTIIESGTTAQRGPATTYKIRLNVDTAKYEGSNGSQWTSIGGGALSDVFYVNKNTLTIDTTINTGENALSTGPITIADGVTVTLADGATWTVTGT